MAIRLVTFDALHTLITPRLPIYVQYSQTFEPYLGVLDPGALKTSFKSALQQLQREKPVYKNGAPEWWGEVIRRTATGAGADREAVDSALPEIVPRLLERFSSSEGYKLFDDSLLTLRRLKDMGIGAAIVSNADHRMRAVIEELGIAPYLGTVLISEEEGVEKPAPEIFGRVCDRVGVKPEQAVHVGDELEADARGAKAHGLSALLVRRLGADGEGEHKEPGEDLQGVEVVSDLSQVVDWVLRKNEQQ